MDTSQQKTRLSKNLYTSSYTMMNYSGYPVAIIRLYETRRMFVMNKKRYYVSNEYPTVLDAIKEIAKINNCSLLKI